MQNKIDLEIEKLLEEKKKGKITFEFFHGRLMYLESLKKEGEQNGNTIKS